jgi:hypothetical protein
MGKKTAVALCAAIVAALSASSALAGEVTGPPGAGNVTPKPVKGNSICAFSGLNDFVNGPTDFHVQSYGQDVRAGRADPTDKTTEARPGFLCNATNLPLHG